MCQHSSGPEPKWNTRCIFPLDSAKLSGNETNFIACKCKILIELQALSAPNQSLTARRKPHCVEEASGGLGLISGRIQDSADCCSGNSTVQVTCEANHYSSSKLV